MNASINRISRFFCIYILIINASIADEWTDKLSIKSLQTSRVDFERNIIINGTCVNDNKAFIDSNRSNYKEIFSMLLAASMANKKIELLCSDTCASMIRCRILDVKL
jgi:hypothetical protein